MMLGPLATQEAVDKLRHEMGLDQPLPQQFLAYLDRLLHGDLGRSWQTSNPVLVDLAQRLPATLELVTLGLLVAVGLPLGLAAGRRPMDGWPVRPTFLRSGRGAARFLAGPGADLPVLQRPPLGAPPVGRLDFATLAPDRIHRLVRAGRPVAWRLRHLSLGAEPDGAAGADAGHRLRGARAQHDARHRGSASTKAISCVSPTPRG